MLPILNTPLYELDLPSGKKLTFRPFKVGEEKLLLMAKHSNDPQTMIQAVKQVISNCLNISLGDVERLPLFDLEFLFLHLIARSIGEVVPLKYKCNRLIDANTTCGMISVYEVDLLKIQPTFGEGHTKKIELTSTQGLLMQYPTFKSFTKIAREDLPAEEAFSVIAECIEKIYDAQKVYETKDVPKDELEAFIDALTPAQVRKIDQFFETLPKIQTTIHFQCPRCHATEDILVEGIDSFFV